MLLEPPAGYLFIKDNSGFDTICTQGMWGPKHRVSKLVLSEGKYKLLPFKGQLLSKAHVLALQPWVDSLNKP